MDFRTAALEIGFPVALLAFGSGITLAVTSTAKVALFWARVFLILGVAVVLGFATASAARGSSPFPWLWLIPLWGFSLPLLVIALQWTHRQEARNFPLAPKLKISFDMSDPGCVRRNTSITFSGSRSPTSSAPSAVSTSTLSFGLKPISLDPRPPDDPPPRLITVTYYRMKVEAVAAPVTDCHGRLLSVSRDGNVLFGGDSLFRLGNAGAGTVFQRKFALIPSSFTLKILS